MALSIVAQASEPASESLPGITKSSRWSCDIFTGTADALIAAGLITADQLKPQKGRTPGYTAFLANGDMCPLHLRTWREPGFKAIREQRDGTYSVEVTVAKDVQLWRRRAENAAKHEREQARVNEELAKSGSEYRNWRFRQDFGGCAETWEGTKAQLQAAGLGVGMMFPGEPGVGEYLTCKCPLGFTFRIHLPEYSAAKAAAGIYIAHSSYLPSADEAPFEPCAPGVLQQVWMPSCWGTSDYFTGTADALVRAGIVPSIDLFPGQPGRTKMQASYRADWSPMGAANQHEQRWGATIRKRGKAEFIVEKPVSSAEQQRRRDAHKAYEEDRKQQQAKLAEERKQLRQGVAPQVTIEQFRSDRTRMAEFTIKLLWSEVFAKEDGALSFDLSEDSELWTDLAEAFQTIRDAVRQADILRDKKKVAAAQTRLKLVAARNDEGLQSLLRDAKGLRLVHSAPDDEQG